jgi:DNA-binding MarR family transcriptional regulator
MQDSKIHLIHERFMTIVELAAKLERMPRRFGTEEPLSSREIHLIEASGDNGEALSVTDLAKLLGITKGAVSQNLKKMEKKGLTIKIEDPQNSSRSIVKLTSKGKAAYYAHRHWHETMDGGFKAYFMELENEKVDFLLGFIGKVEDFIKRAMK